MTPALPPPIYHCIKAEAVSANIEGNSYIVVAGDPLQLNAFLPGALWNKGWIVEARAEDNGIAFARLKGPLTAPYREIGSIIFEAQTRQLAVTFLTNPPICEVENNAQKN